MTCEQGRGEVLELVMNRVQRFKEFEERRWIGSMHGASIRLLQEQAWLSVRAGEVRRTPGDSSLLRA